MEKNNNFKNCYDFLFKKALSNLIKKREYHTSTPSRKREMLEQEIEKLYRNYKSQIKGGQNDSNRGYNAQEAAVKGTT